MPHEPPAPAPVAAPAPVPAVPAPVPPPLPERLTPPLVAVPDDGWIATKLDAISPDVGRCPKCGHESGGTLSLDLPALPEGNVEVYVVWKTDRATNSELAALRRAFAAYRDIPIGELRRVATGGELYLGQFEHGTALDMQRAGAAEGLVVVTR